MRKLQTKDLFNFARVISKANLKDEIKPVLKLASEGKVAVEDIGIEGFLTVLEVLTAKKSEQALYEVLAGPLETTATEIENMDLEKLIETIQCFAEENDLKNFFTLLSNMITKK